MDAVVCNARISNHLSDGCGSIKANIDLARETMASGALEDKLLGLTT